MSPEIAKNGVSYNHSPSRERRKMLLCEQNALDNMRAYVEAIWRSWGKNMEACEKCGSGRYLDIHHTKYEGATIYDLQLLCRSCHAKLRGKVLQ